MYYHHCSSFSSWFRDLERLLFTQAQLQKSSSNSGLRSLTRFQLVGNRGCFSVQQGGSCVSCMHILFSRVKKLFAYFKTLWTWSGICSVPKVRISRTEMQNTQIKRSELINSKSQHSCFGLESRKKTVHMFLLYLCFAITVLLACFYSVLKNICISVTLYEYVG